MKFFCPEPLPSQAVHPLFYFRFAKDAPPGGLFREHLPPNYFESADYSAALAGADAVILPNNFASTGDADRAYIGYWIEKAENLGKPLYLFAWGDLTDQLQFDPRAHVFRLSAYRSTIGRRDIVMPTLTEDLGAAGISIRPKADRPVVSFCGQAGYKTARQWASYWLKNVRFGIKGFKHPALRARKIGVYWRRAMLRACQNSSLVITKFIIRHSFSGAYRTIELDAVQARKEFIDSIVDSDFVLAPKGDGNYSNRFLEALSMGRIPVVVDTDIVLPLEAILDYSRLMVRVPMDSSAATPHLIRRFYDALSSGEWEERQREARLAFGRYLRTDRFFEHYFRSRMA